MPAALTYPGVYIEEVPSGVRTITGVATSITAFAGWTAQGDTDRANFVQSWPEFERKLGGLDSRSLLGHSVYHFFNNGGQQAYIIRLAADDAKVGSVALKDGSTEVLTITARNQGEWSKYYGVKTKQRADDATRFQLSVVYFPPNTTQELVVESFENVSMSAADRRFVTQVIEAGSELIKAEVKGTGVKPPTDTVGTAPKLAGGADGTVLQPSTAAFENKLILKDAGIYLLDRVDIFNLVCVPGETDDTTVQSLQKFCRDHRAFLIVDCQQGSTFTSLQTSPPKVTGDDSINSAFYFPWVNAPDPLQENRLKEFPPCGFVAGLYAKTDSTRGVWKAPAGIDASLTGAAGLKSVLTDMENGQLNIRGFNCLRNFKIYGNVVWGARSLRGNNEIGSEWKYVPVRRMALFLEESLFRGSKWVVFEPNDEPLWAQIRLNIGAFMQNLFRQGAFQGRSPREAYLVKCDRETTTQNDINLGIVNILVGFAPLKPAEFVVIKIQQLAGQVET